MAPGHKARPGRRRASAKSSGDARAWPSRPTWWNGRSRLELAAAIENAEIDDGQGEGDEAHRVGVGAAQTEIEALEGDQERLPSQRRSRRTWTTPGQHVDDVEGADRGHGLQDEHNEQRLGEPGQRHVTE